MSKPKKKCQKEEDVSAQNFNKYFQSLAIDFENVDITDFIQNSYISRMDSTFCELDEPITEEEIRNASTHLSTNKACASDCISNGYFKEGIEIFLRPLEILFNYIPNKKASRDSGLKGISNLFIKR